MPDSFPKDSVKKPAKPLLEGAFRPALDQSFLNSANAAFASIQKKQDALKQSLKAEIQQLTNRSDGFQPEVDLRKLMLEYMAQPMCVATDRSEIETSAVLSLINRCRPHLIALMGRKNEPSLKFAGDLATEIVQHLNAIAESSPEALTEYSRTCHTWPILRSPHPKLTQDENKLFALLKLGEGTEAIIDRSAKWDPNDAAGKLAIHFINHTGALKALYVTPLAHYMRFPKLAEDIVRLPPLRANPDLWAKTARAYFEQHPHLLQVSAFKIPKSKKKKALGVNAHIWTKLRNKFRSMAGKTAHEAKIRQPSK